MNANNLWERDRLRKLTTLERVDAEFSRCGRGLIAAPSPAKIKEWGRKLAWLDKLRSELELQMRCDNSLNVQKT